MIAIPSSWRLAATAALFVAAFAVPFSAGWLVNGWRWEAKAADELRKQQETSNALQASDQTAIRAYRAVVDRLHSRPARRLLICPDVPAAPVAGAGSPAAGVADPGPGEDIGPAVRACLGELYRYKALSDALAARE